jgi:serine/threonine protein kinase/tetratricopeptide (TPR) repeat protein
MSGHQNRNVESIFSAALDKDTPALRTAFLEGACGVDAGLRSKVDALLEAHREAGDFLDAPAVRATGGRLERGTVEKSGTMIGPYKLLQLIGEGGMGAVYMAEQERPVRRRVALKIIKLGMDTKRVIARFEAERQALAMTDHPNIAKVLDAGATETGRPYFVMELVRGISLTDYCDRNQLTTAERLELFTQVCNAVQHAHQKGLIHRDLKPSNVMVTLHDSKPVPKVIDFGIAKAMHQRLTEKTIFTEYGQFIGTPIYMSPEQAEMSGLDVDTRSDIYSLGVILYELLTGKTPVDADLLKEATYGEIQRIIREDEPAIPSTRVTRLGDETNSVARNRRTECANLSRLFRGDLDWIVMRAMEKDRTRRYDTAQALGDDVHRHMRNEPVLAGPPSAIYKIRKFVRRNRLAVMGGSLAAGAVLIGLSLAVLGFLQARTERDDAEAARKQANLEAQRSSAISTYLQEKLVAVDPRKQANAETSVQQVLEEGRALFGDDHAIVAGVLYSWATNLRVADRHEAAVDALVEALELYRRAYGSKHASVAIARSALAEALAENGEYAKAEEQGRAALDLQREIFGAESLMVAESLDRLTRATRSSDSGGRTRDIQTMWAETVAAYRAALGPQHHETVTQICRFGSWLHERGLFEAASPLLDEGVRLGREVLPVRGDTFFSALTSLTNLRFIQGESQSAKKLSLELIDVTRERLGPTSPRLVTELSSYGLMLFTNNEIDEAIAILDQSVELARRVLPAGDPARLQALDYLTRALINLDDLTRAKLAYKETLENASLCWGEESSTYIQAQAGYGMWLKSIGELDQARTALYRVWTLSRGVFPPGDVVMTRAQESLIELMKLVPAQQQPDLTALFQNYLVDARELWGNENPRVANALVNYASYLGRHGQAAEALAIIGTALETVQGAQGDPKWITEGLQTLDRLYWQILRDPGRPARDYEIVLTSLLQADCDQPGTPAFLSTIGAAQYRLGRYEEARAALTRSEAVRALMFRGGVPIDVAFMAMTFERLDDHESALRMLERLRSLLRSVHYADDSGLAALLAEAETLIARRD